MAHFDSLFMDNSYERLLLLLSEWAEDGADKAAVEQKIWATFGEPWTVMFTDLSGFSRKVADFGIVHFINVIVESEKLFAPILAAHNGFLIKREGDSLLIIFRRPIDALNCAIEMQHACQRYSNSKPPEEKVLLCLGMSHGEILRLGSDDVFGEAVNSASKLGEDTADPDEILLTQEFVAALGDDAALSLDPLDFVPPGSKGAFKLRYD